MKKEDGFKFRISNRRFLGEDCTIAEISGGQEFPAIALRVKNPDFPVEMPQIAAFVQTVLNGEAPYNLNRSALPILFHQQAEGFDLRYIPQGKTMSEDGIEIRLHPAAMSEDLYDYLKEHMTATGQGNVLAVALCRALEPATKDAKPAAKPAVKPAKDASRSNG